MRRKLKIGIVLSGLIMLLGAIGLCGCDEDDEYIGEDVYKGYIKSIYPESEDLTINITYSPYNTGIEMPLKGQQIYVSSADFSDLDLRANQKLTFRIISAQALCVLWDLSHEYPEWSCKIEILKID